MNKLHKMLDVWQKSKNLLLKCIRPANFPSDERYDLVSQVRHAAILIPSNLVEGAVRGTTELLQFVRIAIGSVSELDMQLETARHLSY